MERIRIDRRDLSLRARQRAALEAATTPLICASGGGAEIDEDLLARIDTLLADGGSASGGTPTPPPHTI